MDTKICIMLQIPTYGQPNLPHAIVTVRHAAAAQNLPARKLCTLRGLRRSLGAKIDGG